MNGRKWTPSRQHWTGSPQVNTACAPNAAHPLDSPGWTSCPRPVTVSTAKRRPNATRVTDRWRWPEASVSGAHLLDFLGEFKPPRLQRLDLVAQRFETFALFCSV